MKGKILVVEDDVYLMESIRDILEYANYQVITANSGRAGLDVLERETYPPDLIMSDIMMPVMDGYEFLDAVRTNPNWIDIPFIFLTAKGERADANKGRELGADDYVTKPFGPEDLLVAVSARLRRHRQLSLRREQQILQIKRNILTILHHEFRTPLTYLVAYNDMLKISAEDLTAGSLRMYLQGVDKGAKRLRRLVEDFILLVELETGEAEESYRLQSHVFNDYERLVDPIDKDYNADEISAGRSAKLEIDIQEGMPPIICHPDYLVKAIDCLLDNAFKFKDKERENNVRLRVSFDSDRHIWFTVSDTGRGIPSSYHDMIFEPFYQINREEHEDQGAGAGLTIVKGVTELHHGDVRMESQVGKGSVFSIVMPIYEE